MASASLNSSLATAPSLLKPKSRMTEESVTLQDLGLDDFPFLHLTERILVLGKDGFEIVPGEIELLLAVGIGIEIAHGRGG